MDNFMKKKTTHVFAIRNWNQLYVWTIQMNIQIALFCLTETVFVYENNVHSIFGIFASRCLFLKYLF